MNIQKIKLITSPIKQTMIGILLMLAVVTNSFGEVSTPCVPANGLIGDLNLDNRVDQDDLLILSTNWLKNNCSDGNCCTLGDINGDDLIDFSDVALLSNHWHK